MTRSTIRLNEYAAEFCDGHLHEIWEMAHRKPSIEPSVGYMKPLAQGFERWFDGRGPQLLILIPIIAYAPGSGLINML